MINRRTASFGIKMCVIAKDFFDLVPSFKDYSRHRKKTTRFAH